LVRSPYRRSPNAAHQPSAHAADGGNWVGYRIAKAYYSSASDQQAAIREMIGMTDAHDFLARSGWRPRLLTAK
jgi:hypothetical protein